MNILIVNSTPIKKNDGGVARVSSILANNFLKEGYNVAYLALQNGTFICFDGVNQYFLESDKLKSSENIQIYHSLLKNLRINIVLNQAGVYSSVVNFICHNLPNNVKVITAHHNCITCLCNHYRNILSDSLLGRILSWFDLEFIWNFLLWRHKNRYSYYFKNAIQKSNKVVLLSPNFVSELKTYLPVWDKKKVVAIENPYSFQIRREFMPLKENRVLYVGKLIKAQKQAHLIIPIWEHFIKVNPGWHLDVVGEGDFKYKMEIEIALRGIRNIHIHGHCDPEPFLEKAKILMLTSSFEGFGMVLVEAQAYGVVPIGFNSFSMLKYILNEFQAGIAVAPFSVVDFSEKLCELASDDKKRIEMAEMGFLLVDRFNPSKVVKKWCELLNGLC